eukprot:TRINITY_DN2817_c0_g1_i2.p1 TRINITY_DN2817_c0_g1~~TRINITY_DN2817_c0_g1_i2.p1  ORF type:complete len:138 (-),score=19.34 TRINITY_DN2817_c0_g1_i2:134-547(-)
MKFFFLGLVEFERPKAYNQSSRDALEADATVVSLNQKSPYYYEIGMIISDLTKDSELPYLLSRAFKNRYREILEKSLNWRRKDFSVYTSKLTVKEKKLFELGYRSIVDFDRWRKDRTLKIDQPSIIGKKRKFNEISQ